MGRIPVLVLTPDFPPAKGGIQLLMHRVVSHWRALDATVVTVEGGHGSARDRRINVVSIERSRWGHRSDMVRLNARGLMVGVRARPAVVLSGHLVIAPAAVALRRTCGVPFVQYLYGDEITHRPALLRIAAAHADALVPISSFTARLAAGVRPHSRAPIIPPGVDVPAERHSNTHRNPRPTIITVARLRDAYKGHDMVLRALPRIAERVPDVQWEIVGEGPLRPGLERLASALGVRERVHFHGQVDDAARDALLAQAHVMVMPSRLDSRQGGEGFGIAYLEAGVHGVPVVAGRVGGALDAVRDDETGILVDPQNPEEIARAVLRLLTHAHLARRLGDGGRRFAESLAWERISGEVEQLLLEVAAGNRRTVSRNAIRVAAG